jgi:hypothetical protein
MSQTADMVIFGARRVGVAATPTTGYGYYTKSSGAIRELES